jgi:hypothetical protein
VTVGRQAFEQTQIADQKAVQETEGAESVEYPDTSAYEQYEKQEGDFVEQEPVELLGTEEPAVLNDDESAAK